MFFFNNDPRYTSGWARADQPRTSFSKPAEQMEQTVNLEEFLGAIASAASVANTLAEPWVSGISAHLQKPGTSAFNNIGKSTTDNKFEVKVNISNFSPEEIQVKVVNNSILVEAKHEEKEDKFGFISRQFTRRFVLPEGVVLEKMTCKIAADNIIVISAPRLVEKPPTNERRIPINFVGQPATQSPIPNAAEASKKSQAADIAAASNS